MWAVQRRNRARGCGTARETRRPLSIRPQCVRHPTSCKARAAARGNCLSRVRAVAVLVGVFVLSAAIRTAEGDPVPVMWDPNPVAEAVLGYVVSVQTAAGEVLLEQDVGNQTSFVYPDAVAGQEYYFTVTAYNVLGPGPASPALSAFSNAPPTLINPGNRTNTRRRHCGASAQCERSVRGARELQRRRTAARSGPDGEHWPDFRHPNDHRHLRRRSHGVRRCAVHIAVVFLDRRWRSTHGDHYISHHRRQPIRPAAARSWSGAPPATSSPSPH